MNDKNRDHVQQGNSTKLSDNRRSNFPWFDFLTYLIAILFISFAVLSQYF